MHSSPEKPPGPEGFSQFTEDGYRLLLDAALARWPFVTYVEALAGAAGCVWRHDVDFSVHRAVRMATIEAEVGARATYFILLRSPFYNALEPRVSALIRRLPELGHDVGIHLDGASYGERVQSQDDVAEVLSAERQLLVDCLGLSVTAFSFHNPTVRPEALTTADRVGGLINAYGRHMQDNFKYVSDSNGYWRHDSVDDVIASSVNSAHVLTHPEWWTPTPMSPRARVSRAIDGRAARQHADYDDFLTEHGRENVR